MRSIDLPTLEIFRAVVREGGILRAATRLNRVQSNITTRIKQLEQRLGVELFRRSGRGLALTPAGELLLGYAERLLNLADEAETALRAEPNRRTLRLGSMESTAASRLPALLSRLHRQAPEARIELQTGTTGALLARLRAFELDAVFVGQPFSAEGLNAVPMFDEELVLVSAKARTSVSCAADLAGETLLAFSQGCSYRMVLEGWLRAEGIAPQRVLELGSYQAIVACAAAGTGCGIVPVSVLDALQAASNVRRHALPAAMARNVTHLVWADAPPPTLAALMSLARDAA